jgi:hypothetical protein
MYGQDRIGMQPDPLTFFYADRRASLRQRPAMVVPQGQQLLHMLRQRRGDGGHGGQHGGDHRGAFHVRRAGHVVRFCVN